MAITRIDITIQTGEEGTNGHVYLALGGREFHLDRQGINDFKKNNTTHIVLGVANNVDSTIDPNRNDPTKFFQPMDKDDLDRFPKWIRLEDNDSLWEILSVKVTVTDSGSVTNVVKDDLTGDALPGAKKIFLGQQIGKYLFL
jgi:hypothetical protein